MASSGEPRSITRGCVAVAGSSVDWQTYIVAPVFADFAGRSWESAYPRVMEAYYGAVAGVCRDGSGCDVHSEVVGNYGSMCRELEVRRCDELRKCSVQGDVFRTRVDEVEGSSAEFESNSFCDNEVDAGATAGFGGVVENESGTCKVELSLGRGPNYAKNKASRVRKARAKAARVQGLASVEKEKVVDKCDKTQETVVPEWREKKGSLQSSLESKWRAENELREFEAVRKLRLLKMQDETALSRMQKAQVLRTTEVCKVQTEKAFGTLKRTGNVPGFAETVVSEPSLTDGSTARSNGECISPDSSVSQQEIRKMQQDLLEYEKKEADYKHMLRKVKEANPLLYDHVVRIGPLKTAFTLESDGGIPVEEFGEVRDDGKFHVAYPSADIITNKERARLEALGDLHFPGIDDHEYLLGQAGGF